jgi:hypothetical protein
VPRRVTAARTPRHGTAVVSSSFRNLSGVTPGAGGRRERAPADSAHPTRSQPAEREKKGSPPGEPSTTLASPRCTNPKPGGAALWKKGLEGWKNADRHDRPFHGLTDRGRPKEDTIARPHRAARSSRACEPLSATGGVPKPMIGTPPVT